MWIRRLSQYAFVVLSAWALWHAVEPVLASSQGIGAKLGALFSVDGLSVLSKGLVMNPWLYAMIGVFWLIGKLTERSMRREFSEFWQKLVVRLENSGNVP